MSQTRTRKSKGDDSFIYFIQCNGEGGPIKIGYARCPTTRLWNIQCCNPYPLRLLAQVAVIDAIREESVLHSRFKHLEMSGEWFRCDPEILALAAEAGNIHAARRIGTDAFIAGFADAPPPETGNWQL